MENVAATWFLVIIAMMILEGVVLAAVWVYRQQGIEPAQLAVNLLAGISLLMAAVVVAVGGHMPWLIGCLAVALMMHLFDLRMRWYSGKGVKVS